MTFHKAFDQVRDPLRAIDGLIELGVDRVLTSGGQATALEGIETLAALVERAKGRLILMAGGRLDAHSVPRVIREGHVNEVHLGSAVVAVGSLIRREAVRAMVRKSACACVDARRVAGNRGAGSKPGTG